MALLRRLWTVGHSTRSISEFLPLLQRYEIRLLIDVRTIPRSRHNPQFNIDILAKSMADAQIGYRHAAVLGGLRKAKKDSINLGWRNLSFRGYADYMQTDEFQRALEELMADVRLQPTAIMCAEAVPWRCHRTLIADALMSRGWTVRHIMSHTKSDEHTLTTFAVIEHERVTYPRPPDPSRTTRLF